MSWLFSAVQVAGLVAKLATHLKVIVFSLITAVVTVVAARSMMRPQGA